MTKDEWKELLKEAFPDEVQGYKRGDTVPSDVPYMEEFPPFIIKDKVVASLINLVIRQMLSNDKQLKAGYESSGKDIADSLSTFMASINAKRATSHTLTLQGDVTGSTTFNNDSNITVTTTNKTVLVGAVQWYAGHNLPSNHLLCNGQEVSRSTYAKLFAVIGTTYGAGNGSTTFNLPNLIGRFAEGATSPGSYISAGLPNIWGAFAAARRGDKEGSYVAQGAFAEGGRFSAEIGAGGGDDWGSYYDFNANRSNGIYGASGTVQPPALTLKPIIRYA